MNSIDDASVEEWREAAKAFGVTGWFNKMMRPVHDGPYEMLNESTGRTFYAYWAGFLWLGVGDTPDEAEKSTVALIKLWPWRGLVRQP